MGVSRSECRFLSIRLILIAMSLLVVASSIAGMSAPALAQSTFSCSTPGSYDMVQIMRMQDSWAKNGDYLTNQGRTLYMFQATSGLQKDSKGQWTSGNLNYIKNFHKPPTNPPTPFTTFCSGSGTSCSPYDAPARKPNFSTTAGYWSFPADVNSFDTSYVYLWITEIDWNNPYSYKAFNSNGTNHSFPFAPRCAVPGQQPQIDTLQASSTYAIYPPNIYDTTYNPPLINTRNEQFTSADCTGGHSTQTVGNAFTEVNAVQTGFVMHNDVTGKTPTLNYVPVVYWYECNTSYGSCGYREEFDYGFDPNTGDFYGEVQWLHFNLKVSTTVPDQTSTFNYLEPGNGNFNYTTISFPPSGCPD